MRSTNASCSSETLNNIMQKQTKEAVKKTPAAASAGMASSPPPERRKSRRVLPPSDPALVKEVQDPDSVSPAQALQDGQPTRAATRSRREGEATYGKGSTPAPPVNNDRASTAPDPKAARAEASQPAEGKAKSAPAPDAGEAPPKVPSPKRTTPDDDDKRGESASKKQARELPLYVVPSFLSDEHAMNGASVNASWDPAAWNKHCKRGAAYRSGSEASTNTRCLVFLLRALRARAQDAGFLQVQVADRFLRANLVRLNSTATDNMLTTMWSQEFDKASIEQVYLAFVPDKLRKIEKVAAASKQGLIEELVACKAPFMFFDYMEELAKELREGSYTQMTTHDEAVASMLQMYIFCAERQFELSVRGFEADADEAEDAAGNPRPGPYLSLARTN